MKRSVVEEIKRATVLAYEERLALTQPNLSEPVRGVLSDAFRAGVEASWNVFEAAGFKVEE